jgi:outer membrane protein TolC
MNRTPGARLDTARTPFLTAMLGGWLMWAPSAHAQSLPLAAAVDSAFATHPALARAQAYELSAAEVASGARGRRWPSVSLRSGLTHFKEPMLATPIHAFDSTGALARAPSVPQTHSSARRRPPPGPPVPRSSSASPRRT